MAPKIKQLPQALAWPIIIKGPIVDPPPDPFMSKLNKAQLVQYETIRLGMNKAILQAQMDACDKAMDLAKGVR